MVEKEINEEEEEVVVGEEDGTRDGSADITAVGSEVKEDAGRDIKAGGNVEAGRELADVVIVGNMNDVD